MADNTATDAPDTSVADEVDTSTVEEAMDDGVSFETEEDNQPDESNEAEESDDTSDFDEGADGVAEESKEKEESEKSEESETEETEADEEAEDTPAEKPEKGKPDPDKAKKAFDERELRRQIQKEERLKQEAVTLDRYLKEAQDDEDELAKRQLQVESYNVAKERAALNEEKLTTSIARAKADITLLSSTDPIIQEQLGEALDEFQATRVVLNEYGDIVSVKEDVYQYLQRKADSITKLTGIGARQESQNKAKQKSRTMTTPSAKPKEGKQDLEMDAFDEEAKRW